MGDPTKEDRERATRYLYQWGTGPDTDAGEISLLAAEFTAIRADERAKWVRVIHAMRQTPMVSTPHIALRLLADAIERDDETPWVK